MPVGATPRRFTTADYHAMIEAGILGPEDRVELLGGQIYVAEPIGSPHAACVLRLNRWFSERVGNRALVSVQSPVELSAHSEPEPDLALLAPRENFYADRHPTPAEVLLLIEVAAESYRYDRTLKLRAYAAAAVPEVWIVGLVDKRVEVFREPKAGRYRIVRRVSPGEAIAPLALPELALDPAALFA